MTVNQKYHEKDDHAGAASGDEVRRLQDIVSKKFMKNHRLPEGVKNIGLRFGEDSTGDPAVWVIIQIPARNDLNPSKEWIAELRHLADEVQSEIRESGSERWPYVSIEAA